MRINFKVRFKNPVFYAQLILAVLTPIFAYAGISAQEITTWKTLGGLLFEAVSNPYVVSLVIVSVWNALNDPTTRGLSDSARAMGYETPPKPREK